MSNAVSKVEFHPRHTNDPEVSERGVINILDKRGVVWWRSSSGAICWEEECYRHNIEERRAIIAGLRRLGHSPTQAVDLSSKWLFLEDAEEIHEAEKSPPQSRGYVVGQT